MTILLIIPPNHSLYLPRIYQYIDEERAQFKCQTNAQKTNISKRKKRLSLHFPHHSNKKIKSSKINRRLSLPIRFETNTESADEFDDEKSIIYQNTEIDVLCIDIKQSLFSNKYKIMQHSQIGGGTFGAVYECINIKNNQKCAVKIRKKSTSKYAKEINLSRLQVFNNEINVLKSLPETVHG